MSLLNKEEVKAKYLMWSKCENTIAVGGQEYEVEGRKFTRADLPEVRKQMNYWESRYNALGKKRKSKRFIIRDDV